MGFKYKEALIKYSKQELEDYYINELHSFSETERYFNLSQSVLQKILAYYNIKKTPEQVVLTNQRNKDLLKNKIDIDNFKIDYLSNKYRQEDLAKMYSLSKQQVRNIIYKESLNKLKKDKYFSNYTLDEIISIIDKSANKSEILQNLTTKNKEKYATELNISYNTLLKLLDHYHIDNISKKLGYMKAKDSKIKKYGSANNIDKIKETNLAKYGKSCILQIDEFKKKAENTKYSKYGSKTYNNRKKFLNTMNNLYSDGWESLVKKTQKTNIEKYGAKYYSMTDEFKNKNSLLITSLSINNSNYTDEYKKLYIDKEASVRFLQEHNKEFTCQDLAERFNCKKASIYIWSSKYKLSQYIKTESSHYEKDIILWLQSLGIKNIKQHCRKVLSDLKELDIYLPDYKLAIEFNGIYWHSTLNIADKNYHFNKSKECEKLGIHLIHIYEHEWVNIETQNKIKELIKILLNKNVNKIYARKCNVKMISNDEAKVLNENNHLQGHRNAQVTYGLFYNNKLVQLMSFSKTKYNKNLKTDNSREIIRGCPSSNNIVVGGVEKLFKKFIEDYNPEVVFSYSDFNKFSGNSYQKIGMKFIGFTGPDMSWILNSGDVVRRNPSKHALYKQNSIAQIFGAGSKKFQWVKNKEAH